MTLNNKKVLVIFCGGTIIMTRQINEHGKEELRPPRDAEDSIRILNEIAPQLKIESEDIAFIANIDSTEIKPRHWDQMLSVIEEKYDEYDGFVITHGTDTISYTAAALNIGLENLNKPVILTGSQIPGCEIYSDARRNFVNAMLLAAKHIRGVYVIFDERIIAGGRSTKISESKLDAFRSVNSEMAGEIKVEMDVSRCLPQLENAELKVNRGFYNDIIVYHVFPGADPSDLLFMLEKDRFAGIILRGFGAANLPVDFLDFFKKAEEKKLPVIVSTQCMHGKTSIGDYASGSWFTRFNVFIDGYDQSIETLTVKLQHAIALKPRNIGDIKKIMHKNYSGEIEQQG